MATASSAKSTSSMAALLLVLAIVAGTCASGAYAVPIEVDPITCGLNVNATIYLNGAYPSDGVVLPAEGVNPSDLVNPLYIEIASELYQVETDLSNVLSTVTGLVKLVIACGSCGQSTYPNTIAISVVANELGIVQANVVVCAALIV